MSPATSGIAPSSSPVRHRGQVPLRGCGSSSSTCRGTTACSGCSEGRSSYWSTGQTRHMALTVGSLGRPLLAPERWARQTCRSRVHQHERRQAQPARAGRLAPSRRTGRPGPTGRPTCSATRAPATCWPTAPTSGVQELLGPSPSPPRRSTPSSARTTCAPYERPPAGRAVPAQVGSPPCLAMPHYHYRELLENERRRLQSDCPSSGSATAGTDYD
jgi:hypothetical protein